MTPNPNPSPELREAIAAAKIKARDVLGIAWHNLEEISRFELVLAALSPQTLPAPGEVELPTEEQLGDWLVENCGKGIPHGEARDRAGMLHGLAYVLRQIEGTNSYTVHIGQCNSATSAIRMALNHFAREALATVAAANDEGVAEAIEAAAKVCDDLASTAASIQAAIELSGGEAPIKNAQREAAETLAAAIRLLSQGEGK